MYALKGVPHRDFLIQNKTPQQFLLRCFLFAFFVVVFFFA